MLYSSFRAMVMCAAVMGLMHMIAEESYIYIFFPIAIIIWAVYSFFDEDDREYLRRNGIDPDEISWFFPEYSDYGVNAYNSSSNNSNHVRYQPKNNTTYRNGYYERQDFNSLDYKGFKDKCKRNFKIEISKD